MKSRQLCPVIDVILTDYEVKSRALKWCLFMFKKKKVKGAFIDIFRCPKLIITLDIMCLEIYRKAGTAKI
jgi:hypothetical protein